MTEFDDDELDRRIRATLDDAGSDAPRATPLGTAAPVSDHRRWWAAAAAVVLVAGGVVALAARHEADVAAPTTSALPSTSAPSTSVAPAEDCDANAPDQYDGLGSIHTIVPNAQPIDVAVTFSPLTWCSGGQADVTVSFTNHGVGIEHLQSPQLIVDGGPAKWPIATLAPLDLAPGEERKVTTHVQVPNAPPGSYTLHIYGFDGGASVELDGPVACDGSNLTATATAQDGALGNVRTDLVVTNTSAAPCLLLSPVRISGSEKKNNGAVEPVEFHTGTYFGDPPPLPSRVLQPGASALMILGTSNGCDDPAQSHLWSDLFISVADGFFGYGGSAVSLYVPLTLAQPTCGLSISAWGSPTP
jgi:hypothetical protein